MADRRYALQPLCDALACSPDALKARLGLDRRQIAAYLASGLSEARADQLAVKAGLPTHLVWPAFGYEVCAECAEPFAPRRKGHRFCSTLCRRRVTQREWTRRRYRTDEAWAASERERARGYYVECREYVRNRQNRQRQSVRAKYENDHKVGKKTGEFSLAVAPDSLVDAPFSPQSPQARRETVAA